MIKHKQCGTKLYNVWIMIKQRCYNINNKDYKNYGARSIEMCDEWRESYLDFFNWAKINGYKEGLSLDRIDVNGSYKPSNCRWITNTEQQNNKRNTIYIEYEKKLITISELSKITNIKREVLEMRYIRGDRNERLIRSVRKRS